MQIPHTSTHKHTHISTINDAPKRFELCNQFPLERKGETERRVRKKERMRSEKKERNANDYHMKQMHINKLFSLSLSLSL